MRGLWLSIVLITLTISFVVGGVYFMSPPAPEAQNLVNSGTLAAQPVQLRLARPGDMAAAGTRLTGREKAALQEAKWQLRGLIGARTQRSMAAAPGALPLTAGRESQAVLEAPASRVHGNPATFVIGRNSRNTRANDPNFGSTLAEPAAANNARMIFAAGNFDHAEWSSDGGVTWTNVPLPEPGPAEAPILCCDQDVVIDDARRLVLNSYLYINLSATNGIVAIDVRRSIVGGASCTYFLDPGGTGNNVLPDYPKIKLTKNFVYIATNSIGPIFSGGQAAQMWRFPTDPIYDCAGSVPGTVFSWPASILGQRVWNPAEGANIKLTMYWGQMDNSSLFRIFSWPEAAGSPTSVTRAVSPSTFAGSAPDCRGGVNNTNFIDSVGAGIFGFNNVMAVGDTTIAAYWQVIADSVHTQGHIHAAVFSRESRTLLAQPHVFNNEFCIGIPAVSASKEGDFGITLAFGGKAGGGGLPVRGAVGIDDEFTSGLGFFDTIFTVASGTHNPPNGRFGDYFVIHPYEPCEKWFSATSYALNGGTALANVNSRYVEFGRNRSRKCYESHRDQFPNTLAAPR
jgi:hypothetical protein